MKTGETSGPLIDRTDAPFPRSPLMYLAPEPFKRITLQVAFTEGTRPSNRAVHSLEHFLEGHCHKPLDLVVGDPIAPADARGAGQQLVALRSMRGPATADSAYLYVLFYNGRLTAKPTERRGRRGVCYVSPMYPCAIFVDVTHFDLLHPQ